MEFLLRSSNLTCPLGPLTVNSVVPQRNASCGALLPHRCDAEEPNLALDQITHHFSYGHPSIFTERLESRLHLNIHHLHQYETKLKQILNIAHVRYVGMRQSRYSKLTTQATHRLKAPRSMIPIVRLLQLSDQLSSNPSGPSYLNFDMRKSHVKWCRGGKRRHRVFAPSQIGNVVRGRCVDAVRRFYWL
ncbi:hypothetical protein F2P81_022558 [Scophthalmus maximus]|uniref:Uncharacterized protein n=1 Tax=Scophthalmus maximus TaxID=52904 RepID=A0A6A4RYI8_SCOMX|nr:hypothetical protein F2P81_022558 [Scophthalmus maximus]